MKKSSWGIWLKFFEYLSLVFLILLLSSAFLHSTGTVDIYWQLRAGIDLIQKGYSPFIDHYSTGHYGDPIHYIAILYQALIGSVHEFLGGFTSVHILHFLARLALLFVAYRIVFRVVPHPFVRVSLLAIFVACVLPRSLLRAELFSQLWMLVLCEFLWRKDRILKSKEFILLCFSQVIWTHFHSSAVFGYLIVGAYLLDQLWFLWRKKNKSEMKVVIFQGLGFLVTGFINPLFSHPLMGLLKVNEFAGIIAEWTRSPYIQMGMARQFYICLSIVAIVHLIRKKSYFTVYLILALLVNIFVYKRMFINYLIITFPFTVRAFQDLFVQKIQLSDKKSLKFFAVISFAGVLIFTYLPLYKRPYNTVRSIFSLWSESETLEKSFSLTTEYSYLREKFAKDLLGGSLVSSRDVHRYLLNKEKVLGNVLNDYANGAMIQYFWGDRAKVFIDGRTSALYSLDDFKLYESILHSQTKIFEYMRKNDVKYAFLLDRNYQVLERVLRSGAFGVDYLGRKSLLLKRSERRFLNLSKALASSMCIAELDLKDLRGEKKEALKIGSVKNAYLIDFIIRYLEAKDKKLYLSNTVLLDSFLFWKIYSYLTWKEGLWELSLAAFKKLNRMSRHRFFMIIDVSLYLKHWESARNRLHFMIQKVMDLDEIGYGILYYLAHRLNKESGKKMVSEKFIEKVKERSKGQFKMGRQLIGKPIFDCSLVASKG